MKIPSARPVPVRFEFAVPEGRAEGWGRFGRLSAGEAEFLTRFRLERGDRLVLAFDLPGERFEGVPARVAQAWTDADGYCAADLRFEERASRLRLGRALRDLLSR